MEELLPTLRNAGCTLLASHFERTLAFMPDTPCLKPLLTPTHLMSDPEFCQFTLGVHTREDQALRELPLDHVSKKHRLSRIAKYSRKLTRNSHKSRAAPTH